MSKKKESLFRIILNKDYICGYMAKTEGFEKPKAKKRLQMANIFVSSHCLGHRS